MPKVKFRVVPEDEILEANTVEDESLLDATTRVLSSHLKARVISMNIDGRSDGIAYYSAQVEDGRTVEVRIPG